MSKIILLYFFLFTLSSFSRDDARCNWIQKVRNSDNIETQLQLIKKKHLTKRTSKCNVSLVYSYGIEKDSLEKLTSIWNIEAWHLKAITYTENYLSEKSEISQPAFVLHFNCSWVDQVRNIKNFKVQLDLIKKNYIFSNESICDVELSYTKNNPHQEPSKLWSSIDFNLYEAKQLDSIYLVKERNSSAEKEKSRIVLAVNCSWLDTLEKVTSTEKRLELLQENFGPCGLVIADGIPVSSDSSTFPVHNMKLFINSIKKEEVNSIILLKGEAATTLYGTAGLQGIILIGFEDKGTMDKIATRVWELLKKKSKD